MYKVLDLFSGIGGFSLGLESTGGFETIAFCEVEKYPLEILNKHWPNVPVYNDIKELTYERLKEDNLVPDVITGGFPCQDISCAGKGKGIKAERSGLWSEMFRLIRDVRPAWAIIENVSALRSKGLTLVLQNLCEIGYMCEWHCIPASAVGAPHQRDRIWVVAYPISECPQPRIRETLSRWKDSEASDTEPCCGSTGRDTLLSEVSDEERPHDPVANPNNSGDRTSQRRDMPKIRKAILQGWQEHTLSEPGGYCEDVANPNSKQLNSLFNGSSQEGSGETSPPGEVYFGNQGSNRPNNMVANSNSKRLQGHSEELGGSCEVRTQETPRLLSGCRLSDFWAVEPNVGRVAHGVPSRVDRLKCLGNSVVPQIPQMIGFQILEIERNNNE
jgi:DNA-cytosine methyltransferase